jgi:hypothetical protein
VAVSRFAVTLEKMGVPTAPCVGENVGEYIQTYDKLYATGMPLRFTVFPLPVAGMPRDVHEKYVSGNDPLTGAPILQELISALTRPLTKEEQLTGPPPAAATEPRLLPPDTEEKLQELFKTKDWTDYLPVVLPTVERVAAMLKGTSHKPDEIVKTLTWPGGARQMTVEKVAACAVMAGAKPKHLPAILALSTLAPFGNSTTSMANMIIVNGPVRKELGMNAGTHALGPHNEANAVIGRVFTLLSKTAGNIHAGTTAFSSLGTSLQYNNVCYAENEEALPEGWRPVHVQFGYRPEDSVVTLGTGWSMISSVGEVQLSYPPQYLIRDYMRGLSGFGSAALLMVDPLVAQMLHDQHGFPTKESVGEWLAANVKITAGQYWGNGVVASFSWSFGEHGMEPYAGWQKVPPEELIAPYTNSRAINTVVVGGQTNNLWYVTDFRLARGVPVDDWR